jgi:hypothetical protein
MTAAVLFGLTSSRHWVTNVTDKLQCRIEDESLAAYIGVCSGASKTKRKKYVAGI